MVEKGASTIEQLKGLLAARKTLAVDAPTWRKRDKGNLELVSALDIDGVSQEGLEFRLTANEQFAQQNVTCLLIFFDVHQRGGAFERIDWRPRHRHNNKGLGPKAHRFVEQSGSHHHRLADNMRLGWPDFSIRNMPIAIPLNDTAEDFGALMSLVGDKFNIVDATFLSPPDWAML